MSEENPPLDWLGNAGVDERNRLICQKEADGAKARGDYAGARQWQAQADTWKVSRDAEQRREQMRRLNRRARRQEQ